MIELFFLEVRQYMFSYGHGFLLHHARLLMISGQISLNDKKRQRSLFSMSTRGRTRTGTSLRTMDFKSIVSTNSTTRAYPLNLVRRRPDSNRRITVLQTAPLSHLGTTPRNDIKLPENLLCLPCADNSPFQFFDVFYTHNFSHGY